VEQNRKAGQNPPMVVVPTKQEEEDCYKHENPWSQS
jgi:hypothetical protein